MKKNQYKHTQIGYLMVFTLMAVIFLFGFVAAQAGFETLTGIIMIFVILVLTSFLSLTVTIDNKFLRLKFGYGVFKKNFELKEIKSAKATQNYWYNGWGIRIWFWPPMRIYNVSGLDVVELTMKNGKKIRIGTDEPKKLEKAVKKTIT